MRIKALSDIESTNYSETAASNNAATPNGWPEGQAPSTVNDCSREQMAGTKREWNRSHTTISSTGSANAYVLTYTTAPASYINGQRFSFRASFANTGSATANINGLGAKTINLHGASGLAALAGTEIQIAHHVTLEYDNTADVLVLISPSPVTSGSLGTMASQNANAVAITGGSVTGITDLAVADGGTGRSTLTVHGVLIGNAASGLNATSAGTAGQALISNGALADPTFQSFSGIVTVKKQTFTASGTYTPSTGMLYALIEMVGGGGGGGNSGGANQGAGGGGAGQYSRVLTTAAAVGVSQAVTIPAAAIGNGTGGTVSVGTLCTAVGGSPGASNSAVFANGGLGGTGGTSDIATTGAIGGFGGGTTQFAGGTIGGPGASSAYGGGGLAVTNGNGNNGSGFGSGGSGAANGSNFGGNGTKGVVYITEYCSQ